ncbi:MAG: arginine repressor [Deltaproteobacteria bacterium]|nr:arginine repressor [Deltaproteobacteria bacterium]
MKKHGDKGRLDARRHDAARTKKLSAQERAQEKAARQEAIQKLIREEAVGTQEELGRLLAERGFHVTQGTLSRDLNQLGALRVARPGGGTIYGLETDEVPHAGQRLHDVGQLVLTLVDNDTLCVVRTQPGAASAIARAIDLARVPECLATLAGDDTIFVTPVRGVSARKLTQSLKRLFGAQ